MPIFVHLAPASQTKRIRKAGIKHGDRGVFCMPDVPVYYVSHQWVRELRRWKPGPMMAVYFSLLDTDQVWVGHYFRPHRRCGANEATKEIMDSPDAQGYEVILERSIKPSEIRKVRSRGSPGDGLAIPATSTSETAVSLPLLQSRRYQSTAPEKVFQPAG
ncbi:MAG TPA: hypothetical protein VGP82_00020 [Ktedonobacterales bacterium]|jgi:hypothetical protein|nr:hypothetical protein [Ktedonobacterales bacterium]